MIFRASPNFWHGRKGYKPEAIVIHITDGTAKSCINTFLNPRTEVSSHYLIAKTGQIFNFVNEKDSAWHCGKIVRPKWKLLKKGVNPNRYTIGIEHEGQNNDPLTLEQIIASSKLISLIAKKWNIPLDNQHIIPHNWIRSDKICPGKGINIECLICLSKVFTKMQQNV